jgi:TctA family transporter
MGIPGGSSSQATVVDGFPLAKKGQAARALSASYIASLVGGIFGALFLTAIVIIAKPLILFFGSAELFMLGILGISMVGVLSGSSMAKGILACGAGVLLSTMGTAPATGELRSTFGSFYLYDGIKIAIIGLSAFAIPEICDLLRSNAAIAQKEAGIGRGWFRGVLDVVEHKWLVLRSSVIGVIIGLLPGLGGSASNWISYGHAVQTAKDKSKFGKGDIRGVVGPEAANNANEGGGLIPTLLFGIPGSGSMAVFLGGLTLIGIQPGPNMVGKDLYLTYVCVWSLAIANVVATGAMFFISKPISRLATIPFGLMAPFMIMIIYFAAFQSTFTNNDLYTLIVLGGFCTLLKYFNWPRPAFIVGFVISDTIERYFYQTLQFNGWSFLHKPGVILLAIIILISIYFGNKKASDFQIRKKATQLKSIFSYNVQYIFLGLIYFYFLYVVIDSASLTYLGGIWPLAISASMFMFMTYIIFFNKRMLSDLIYINYSKNEGRDFLTSFLWLALPIALSAVFGFLISMIVTFYAILKYKTRASFLKMNLITIGCLSLLLGLAYSMNLSLPRGLLQSIIKLPWPFG